MSLTEKQKRFVEEYIIDPNATQAAIRAGYSKKYANTNAFKLLQITALKEYLDNRLEEIKTEKTAAAQEVLEYLTSVMRGDSESEIVVVEGTGDGCSEASSFTKKPDEKERLKAAELLGKRYSLFTDKVDLSGDDLNINISVDYGEADGSKDSG